MHVQAHLNDCTNEESHIMLVNVYKLHKLEEFQKSFKSHSQMEKP